MLDDRDREILKDVLDGLREGAFPEVRKFRRTHEADRRRIDRVVEAHLLRESSGRYVLTLEGLRAASHEDVPLEMAFGAQLLPRLQDAFRAGETDLVAEDLAQRLGLSAADVRRAFWVLGELGIWEGWSEEAGTGLLGRVQMTERVLDLLPADLFGLEPSSLVGSEPPRLLRVAIRGYRPFREFQFEPGPITVLIGANATGKSSLFDFLRLLGQLASAPMPAEIDLRSAGRSVFHAAGAEKFGFAVRIATGAPQPLEYEAEILGPIGAPRVAHEKMWTGSVAFLDLSAGKGIVRRPGEPRRSRTEWNVPENELALRRALDPTLVAPPLVQAYFTSWRFYSGLEICSSPQVRRPVPTEPEPLLNPDGSNLSALLMWLRLHHPDAWEEVESALRAAVPGFRALNVDLVGGPGTVIGVWHEDGLPKPLKLADLSDGSLRLLCWAALCASPKLPPLLCVDEPEIGLHPRALAVVAGLFRMASARTQVIVATHSPYFLSHFRLDDIAVMRKRDGAAELVRPASSLALRELVAEAGDEALIRLHVSDELETLP